MKAFIVKDDNFETIGFQVESNEQETVFSYGISHTSPFYFTKEVNAEKYITEIFKLKQLEGEKRQEQCFVQFFFETAAKSDGKMNKMNNTFHQNRLDRLDTEILNIINSIK